MSKFSQFAVNTPQHGMMHLLLYAGEQF